MGITVGNKIHPAVICTRFVPCAPTPGPNQGSDMIDWMITLPLTSIRISPAANQRLISFVHVSHPCFAALLANLVYLRSWCAER